MQSVPVCVCGHPLPSHRTYGCIAWRPNPNPRKAERVYCQCKAFQLKKLAVPPGEDLRIRITA